MLVATREVPVETTKEKGIPSSTDTPIKGLGRAMNSAWCHVFLRKPSCVPQGTFWAPIGTTFAKHARIPQLVQNQHFTKTPTVTFG